MIWAFGLAGWSSLAAANNLFTLDSEPATPGNVIEDSAGTAYVGWLHKPAQPMFCKIPVGGTCTNPISLPMPGTVPGEYVASGLFPVFGSTSGTIYAVAPCGTGPIGADAVIIWTSTNGGQSFNAGTINKEGDPDMDNPSNVFLSGSDLLIGNSHVGLGIGLTPAAGGAGSHFQFASPSLYTSASTLGFASPGKPVDVYETLENPQNTLQFYRYKGSGSLVNDTDWEGPNSLPNGEDPRLAGGPSGLFLASLDYGPGGEPNLLDVRKLSGSSFGAPLTLPSSHTPSENQGGTISQAPDGEIAVAWPGTRSSDQAAVMQLFTSTNGGAGFGPATEVARIGSEYAGGNTAQLALGNGGQGWLTFTDQGGLQVADLKPIPPVSTGPTPKPPPTPPTYTGVNRTITTPVGGNLLTLKVPKNCLASLQPFYVGVGKKARHKIARALRSKLKVLKVTFSFDGQKKTLKKRPFRWLIRPPALTPGKKYIVKARVTALVDKHGKSKRVVKTLRGPVSVC
ncbi:MAG: hypothetical protein WB507_03880 [Solirubrobacterales bacterium]